MFVRKYIIPLLAVAGVAFAVKTVLSENKPVVPAAPVAVPATSSFEQSVAGAGIVEASSQNIAIGAHLPGVVMKVLARVGDEVKAGDPLFQIDDRAARAEVRVREAALQAARQALGKLESQPRPEEVPPVEARVREMTAMVAEMTSQLKRVEALSDPRAVSPEEISRRKYALDNSQAKLDQMTADLRLLKAGAWKPDIEIARANVAASEALVESARTELERLTVKAPIDAQVLQVNIRPGEFAPAVGGGGGGASNGAASSSTPLMLLGATKVLHVRVDIDENDAWRIRPDAKAHASLRGNKDLKTNLTFVRIEPYVVPKKSLTGDSAERVDTRVLQVLYAFDRSTLPVYVGQQMDVFIDAPMPQRPAPGGTQ